MHALAWVIESGGSEFHNNNHWIVYWNSPTDIELTPHKVAQYTASVRFLLIAALSFPQK